MSEKIKSLEVMKLQIENMNKIIISQQTKIKSLEKQIGESKTEEQLNESKKNAQKIKEMKLQMDRMNKIIKDQQKEIESLQKELIRIESDQLEKNEEKLIAIPFSKNIKDDSNIKELEIDDDFRFLFTIYNEKCIWENCKIGLTNIINKKYCIKVDIDKRLTAEDLYQDVANQMNINVNCLRLWQLSSDNTSFVKILEKKVNLSNIRVNDLFAQIKDEKDDLLLDANTKTYFLILYTPDCVKPYFFIQMRNYKLIEKIKKDHIYEDKYLKFGHIIDDVVTILNQNLNLKIQNKEVSIYIIHDRKLVEKQYYLSCNEESGSMMILQVNNKETIIDSTSLKDLKTKLKITSYFSNIQDNDDFEPYNIISYIDYMQDQLPQSLTDYFELRNNTRKANIYNFSNISQRRGIIEFPINVKRSLLTEFIKIAFDIKFNENKEKLLLFGREENANVPKSKPFNIDRSNKSNLENIYYCVTSNNVAADTSSETRVIQLSKDAFSISKALCYYMADSDCHPYQQFKAFNDNFFNDSDNTRMFIIDKDNKASPIIKNETHENAFNIDNKNKLRIEIIPDDQIGKELILINKGFVDGFKIQLFEDPFYFSYIKDEPVSSFKKRINQFLKNKQSFKVYKNTYNYSYYYERYVMKDKIAFDSYDKEKTLILFFDIDA